MSRMGGNAAVTHLTKKYDCGYNIVVFRSVDMLIALVCIMRGYYTLTSLILEILSPCYKQETNYAHASIYVRKYPFYSKYQVFLYYYVW